MKPVRGLGIDDLECVGPGDGLVGLQEEHVGRCHRGLAGDPGSNPVAAARQVASAEPSVGPDQHVPDTDPVTGVPFETHHCSRGRFSVDPDRPLMRASPPTIETRSSAGAVNSSDMGTAPGVGRRVHDIG